MLFEPVKPKNRRFTANEFQTELDLAKWMKRPVRTMFYDTPYYPWLPPEPKVPRVNFDLNYQ